MVADLQKENVVLKAIILFIVAVAVLGGCTNLPPIDCDLNPFGQSCRDHQGGRDDGGGGEQPTPEPSRPAPDPEPSDPCPL